MRSIILLPAITLSVCADLRAQTLPGKPHFDVASIKPAANSERQPPPEIQQRMRNIRKPGVIPMPDPGRVRILNWALLDLIAAAYGVPASQVSAPKWLANSPQLFDVDARIPDGVSKEQVNVMLQTLLEERFGLQTHRETQTRQGFALVVGKNGPRLRPAAAAAGTDPSQELSQEERQAMMRKQMAVTLKRAREMQSDGMPRAGFSVADWPSVTTQELASHLIGFVDAPVVDQTGLTGEYDVQLATWKGQGDNPGVTIFEAVEKLGLKLESRKLTLAIVVVDQASKMPTEN